MTNDSDIERVVRELVEKDVEKDNDFLKILYAAREIKRIVERIKNGERDLDQALIDIDREVDFIVRHSDRGSTR